MRYRIFTILSVMAALLFFQTPFAAHAESVRKERKLIMAGNKSYNAGNYRQALAKYTEALQENASSAVGRYNLGMAQIRLGSNPADTTETAKKMLADGIKNMQTIASMGSEKPKLASMANYNLGNIAFNSEDYGNALNLYKQALRLNPSDNAARRNLRITQLKLQNQDQNQDQNQNQNQDQNKDQEQDQNQNKDQNDQQQNQQNKQNQQQNRQNQINQQTADQILQAMENKENQTRARVAGKGDKSGGRGRNVKNW